MRSRQGARTGASRVARRTRANGPAVAGPVAPRDRVNAVIDLSHHNGLVDLVRARADGIIGVIQKATQGRKFVEPTYARKHKDAANVGLNWGASHFGTVQQAAHFLETVDPDGGHLLPLDFGANHQGPSMSLEEARAFVTHVRGTTGRWPGIYSGHFIKELLGTQVDSVLNKCWFWLAQYGPTAVLPVGWPAWTLWQYTDGAVGQEPHEVDGVGRCDRDRFNGTAEQIRSFWTGAV